MTFATTMLDLDGVANLWVDPFHPFLLAHPRFVANYGTVEQTDWETWHHYREYGCTDEIFVEILQDYAREGLFTAAPPFDGVPEAMQRLHAAGHTIHVVTDRPEFILEATGQWLTDYGIPFDSLEIGRDKTVFKRRGDGPYFALDDRTENVQNMRAADIDAILLDWPWNRTADLPRVFSVSDYVDYVLEKTA